jgi:hypothetical protein
MAEIKDIIGYEEIYTIDIYGHIYNKKKQKFLNPWMNNNGYLRVNLYKDGKTKKFLLHRLIALHFIPNPGNKPLVDHINRDILDNRIENLRFASYSENSTNRTRTENTCISITDKNITACIQKEGVKHIKYFKTDELEKAREWIKEKREKLHTY